ncbi:ankyrin repeat protein [Hokovirus HKV1]|uniref:Ankyrin repeat protein n=1 Tax=Hokovirus HKV1 TaxID=1977638 RepID=A0A1V0SEY3_9VIRU|nr:ankyrin repeat protein [Hokovirus HKV1]
MSLQQLISSFPKSSLVLEWCKTNDVNTLDENNNTALNVLLMSGFMTFLKAKNITINNNKNVLMDKYIKKKEKLILLLLSLNSDVNVRNIFGCNTLRYALNICNNDIIDLICKNVIDIGNNEITKENRNLVIAIRNNNNNVAIKLINMGAYINFYSISQAWPYTPLQEAVRKDNNIIIDLLLQKGADISTMSYNNNQVLLFFKHKQLDIVNKLIDDNNEGIYYEKKRHVTTRKKYKYPNMGKQSGPLGKTISLFSYAIEYNEENIARKLLRKLTLNSNDLHLTVTKIIGKQMNNLLHDFLIIYKDKANYIDNFNGNCLIHKACFLKNYVAAKLLIQHGFDINVKNNGNFTALDCIKKANIDLNDIKFEYVELEVKNILENKPQEKKENIVEYRDNDIVCYLGYLIKRYAKEKDPETLDNILDIIKNNDCDKQNKYGLTPLQYAIINNCYDLALYLMDIGHNINNVSKKQDTLLLLSCKKKNNLVTNKILDYYEQNPELQDIYINYQNKKGYTPLLFALKNRNKEIVNRLLNMNAIIYLGTIKEDQLNIIINYGDEDLVIKYIQKGVLVDNCLLLNVMEKKMFNACKILLEKDIKFKPEKFGCKKNSGLLIFHILIDNNQNELLELFLKKHENEKKLLKKLFSVYNNKLETCLHNAINSDKWNIVKILLKYEICITIKDGYGKMAKDLDNERLIKVMNDIYLERHNEFINMLKEKEKQKIIILGKRKLQDPFINNNNFISF